METELSNTKEAGYVSIHKAIDGMYRIISKLERLSQDISGSSGPADPVNTDESVDQPVSLSGILGSGPARINTTVDECLKHIDEIRSLILS